MGSWEHLEELEKERRIKRRKEMEKRIHPVAAAAGAFLPHELVVSEVLTRLPCKPLMRFKCVSNLWRSSIDHHSFRKVHHSRFSRLSSRRLLFVCPDIHNYLWFFCCTPPSGSGLKELDLVHQLTIDGKTHDGRTDVVNGLFCFYRGHRMWVSKISTATSIELPLPLPPCFNNNNPNPDRQKFRFYLGFDCTRNLYKLLKVPYSYSENCHILTLGKDDEWRCIHSGAQIDNWDKSVFLHGTSTLFFWSMDQHNMLVAFSFKEEVFDVVAVPPPPFILPSIGRGLLLQFGDHLALMGNFVVYQKLELWVYGGKMPTKEEKGEGNQDDVVDDVDLVLGGGRGGEAGGTWTKHIINIPYAFRDHKCRLLGNLPTGEMLMMGTHISQDEVWDKSLSLVPVMPLLYSYDPTKEKFQELVLGNKFQNSPFHYMGIDFDDLRMYQYVEDIRPLGNLIRGDESNLGVT